jgi:hypothetical protein
MPLQQVIQRLRTVTCDAVCDSSYAILLVLPITKMIHLFVRINERDLLHMQLECVMIHLRSCLSCCSNRCCCCGRTSGTRKPKRLSSALFTSAAPAMVCTRAFVYSLALCCPCSSLQPRLPLHSARTSLRNFQRLATSIAQTVPPTAQQIPRGSLHDLTAEQLLQQCETPLVLAGVFDHKQLDAEAWCDSLIERLGDRDVHYQTRRSSDGYTEVRVVGWSIKSGGTLLCTSLFWTGIIELW